MALTQVAPPYPIFTDTDGSPLDDGYLYIGVINTDPTVLANQIAVYWDSDFTLPAPQPIRTINGYPSRNGTPGQIYCNSQFSITIKNKQDNLVLYSRVGYAINPGAVVGSAVPYNFTGDGSTLAFTLPVTPTTENATNVYVNGAYQNKDTYSLSGGTVTFQAAPPSGSAIEIVVTESAAIGTIDAQNVTYTAAGGVARSQYSKNMESVSVKDFGAVGDGVTDDTAAIQAAIDSDSQVNLSRGVYKLTDQVYTTLKDVDIRGSGSGTVLMCDAASAAIDINAVGGSDSFVERRIISTLQDLTFKTNSVPSTGLDVASVNPFIGKELRFYGMGVDALKLTSLYYGYFDGLYLIESGMALSDVNNISFTGGDIRPNSGDNGATAFAASYPVYLSSSDAIKFNDTTFESWAVPVIRLESSIDTSFNGSWFEACTGDHVVKIEQSRLTSFNDCYIDAYPQPATSFIKVDNSIPTSGDPERWVPRINFNNSNIRLGVLGGTDRKFVTTVNDENVRVTISNCSFHQGRLYADRSVEFDVKSIGLETDKIKTFYTKPNAILSNSYNSWMPESLSSDWDFSAGANMTVVSGGMTISTTTTDGEFMTGTTAAKITGFLSDGTKRTFQRNCGTNGDMGPTTTDGQSYYFFIRMMCTQDVLMEIDVQGLFAVFDTTRDVLEVKANTWTDFILKTDEDATYAQGRSGNPKIRVSVTNNSGTSADVFVDRLDYMIVNGDYQI